MPVSFPLPFSQFWDNGHAVTGGSFHLTDNTMAYITEGGEVFTATRGTRLWTGRISFARRQARLTRRTDAILSELRESGASFYITPLDAAFPPHDPDGSLLGTATPVISAVQGNGREIGLAGLPPGYMLDQGDFLSFVYGSAPLRHALHQVVRRRSADASGSIPAIQLTPRLRPGLTPGGAVTLIRPFCKAIVRPRSYAPPEFRRLHGDGQGFDFLQTLR